MRVFLACPTFLLASALTAQVALQGVVLTPSGEPAISAFVALADTEHRAVSDIDGRFLIPQVAVGTYTLSISFLGAEALSQEIRVTGGAPPELQFRLQEATNLLKAATVIARTASTLQELQPVTVQSLDATKLRARAVAVPELLRQSSGTLVRRSGGVGSTTKISLNGISGNAIRIYFDGIPAEYLGGGLSLDVLPAAAIRRVDVYKGVLPVSVGTDALGGGVNVLSRADTSPVTELSYTVGSFGLHRVNAELGRRLGRSGAYLGATLFATSARNDYRMRDVPNRSVEPFTNRFGREEFRVVNDTISASRFHNRHESAFGELRVGLTAKPWADLLELAVSGSVRQDELQHGFRVTVQPSGEATRSNRAVTARLRYALTPVEWLQIGYTAAVAAGVEQLRDSTLNIYDWQGGQLPIRSGNGAEVFSRPTARNGQTRTMVHRLVGTADLGRGLRLTASEFLAADRITGQDPFGLRVQVGERSVDPQAEPADYLKLISGLELAGDWLEGRLRAIGFGKHYYLNARSVDVTINSGADRLPVRSTYNDFFGFGGGVRYALVDERAAVRLNYEYATRMPTRRELFGDFAFIQPNYNLNPERSHNINVGLRTAWRFPRQRTVVVDASLFSRKQEDLTRLEVLGDADVARFINEDEVRARGAELSVEASPLTGLHLRASATYQEVSIAEAALVGEESFIGTQVPNTPRFFASGGVTVTPTLRAGPLEDLALFYNVYGVERFSITYVEELKAANPSNVVPAQVQHDLGLSAAVPRLGLLLSAQVENLTDASVFDNFRVPKPGRAFSLKVTYRDF